MSNPNERRFSMAWPAAWLFAGFFCLYLFTAPERLPGGDEVILLGVGDRVARFGFGPLPPESGESARFSSYGFYADGFSKYGLGQSLLDIPVIRAFHAAREARDAGAHTLWTLGVYSLSAATGAAINALFFLVCALMGYGLLTGVTLTLALGLTTMVWPYAQTLFSDPTLGLMWILALFAGLKYKVARRGCWLSLAGFAIGFAVLTKVVAVYAVPLFVLYFFCLLRSTSGAAPPPGWLPLAREALWLLLPLLLMGYAVLWFNKLRYGGYFYFGYVDQRTYDARDTLFGFNVSFPAGLYAQLFSSGKGFLFYNPALLLIFPGWKKSRERHAAETLLIAAIALGMVMIYSKWHAWHGDWSWGPRFLSCLPPLLLLLAAPYWEETLQRFSSAALSWRHAGVALLLAVSLGVQTLGLCIKSNDYILTAGDVSVFKGKFFSNVWPIRDDSLQMHFIPEFSPLAGHLWMLRVLWHRESPDFTTVFQAPPWKSLNRLWIPSAFRPDLFRYNIWWMDLQAGRREGAAPLLYLAAGLGALALLFFFLAVAAARAAEKASSPPRSVI